MVVEGIRLNQIDYIELIGDVFPSVGHPEEVPLTQLLRCPVVELQLQIVFKLADLGCSVQIATFEPGFKHEGHITCTLQIIVLTQSVVVASIYDLSVYIGCTLHHGATVAEDLLAS